MMNNMMDIDLCHPPQKTSSVLFHKHIFDKIDDAKQALIDRCLEPGEMAAVRYGTPDGFGGFIDIHMILGIGGAVKNSGTDTYFFIDGESQNTDVDLSNYYTKEEIDNMFDSIEIPELNLDQYYTKNEITEILETTYVTEDTLLSELENKADNSDITEITEILETKVDSSYVENYFETNVENTVNQIIRDIPGIVEEEIANQNINQQVSDAVDEKLKDVDGVTTETIDEALQNNEYFTTNVITPIAQLETTVKELMDASVKVDNIDGEEMEEWFLEQK